MEPNKRRPGPVSPVFELSLDPSATAPLYRQLYDGLRDAILSGRLAPGARLPSSRVLAADHGVARNTVLQAYDQLRSEGYLIGKRGGGTRVSPTLPDLHVALTPGGPIRAVSDAAGTASRRPDAGRRTRTPPRGLRISKRGLRLIRAATGHLGARNEAPRPFAIGMPAIDAFPVRLWARLAGRRWRYGRVAFGDADPAGERPLREAIATYVTAARGARCTADQVLVTNGAQQALHLIATVLLDPGDVAWLEDPGYVGARMALDAAGARIVPVPVDAHGLDIAAGRRAAPRPRLVYVTPSHQFPLGVVMSASRRLELLRQARQAAAWIVEDDYDSEFRYAGRPLPCLQGLDVEASRGRGSVRVLYVGTFGKTLVPGLRLGYLIVPDGLVDAFRAARLATDRHTPAPEQGVLADFIGEGHYARQIRLVRRICAARQDVLLEEAASALEGLVTLAPDPAGLHLVGRLRPGLDDRHAARLAAAEGVQTSPLSRYMFGARAGTGIPRALLLGYAAHDAPQIRDGVAGLARALGGT